MASIQDLIQLADYKSKVDNPLPGVLANAAQGYFSGVEAKRVHEKQQLDSVLTLLDIEEKRQKIATQRRDQQAVMNIMKAAGKVPLDGLESSAATDAHWNNLGKDGSVPPVNTTESKLARSANTGDWPTGWLTSYHWSEKNGASVDMKQVPIRNGAKGSAKGSGTAAVNSMRTARDSAWRKAKEAAQSAKAQKTLAGMNPADQQAVNMMGTQPDAKKMNVSEDEISAFLPAMLEYEINGASNKYHDLLTHATSEAPDRASQTMMQVQELQKQLEAKNKQADKVDKTSLSDFADDGAVTPDY